MLRSGSSFQLLPVLETEAPLISDSDLTFSLQALGVPEESLLCLANQEFPDLVKQAHRIQKRSGAQLFRANTAGASLSELEPLGWEDRCEALNNSGRALLKEALDNQGIQAGVIRAIASETQANLREAAYGNQAVYLSDTRADLIWLRDFPSVAELRLALRVLKRVSQTEIIASLKPQTFSEEVLQELPELLRVGANYLGLQGAADHPELTSSLKALVDTIGVVGIELDERSSQPAPSAEFEQVLAAVLDLGVAWVALGAHTTPDHVRLARKLRDL